MRKSLVLAVAAVVWSGLPSPGAVIGIGVAATVVGGSQAAAGTAVLPGWTRPCGPNPRCFEQGEARRQAARLRARLAGWRQ